jgi:hypothetical protein
MPTCFCTRDVESVATVDTPCCGKVVCFDFCLYPHMDGEPFRCPFCGTILVAEPSHDDIGDEMDVVRLDDARYGPDLVSTLYRIIPPGVLDAHRPIKERVLQWMRENRPGNWVTQPPTMKQSLPEDDDDDSATD